MSPCNLQSCTGLKWPEWSRLGVTFNFQDRSTVEVQYILHIHFSDSAVYTSKGLLRSRYTACTRYTAATLYCWQWTCSTYCTPLRLYCTLVWVSSEFSSSKIMQEQPEKKCNLTLIWVHLPISWKTFKFKNAILEIAFWAKPIWTLDAVP